MGHLADCSAGLEVLIRCVPDTRSTAPRAMEGAPRCRPRLNRRYPPSPLSSSSLLPRCGRCLNGFAVQSDSNVCCCGALFVMSLDGAALSSRRTCRGCRGVLMRRLLPLFDSNSAAESRLGLTPGGSIAPRTTVGARGLPWPSWPRWYPPPLSPPHSCTRWCSMSLACSCDTSLGVCFGCELCIDLLELALSASQIICTDK